jgi:hypothetical protein
VGVRETKTEREARGQARTLLAFTELLGPNRFFHRKSNAAYTIMSGASKLAALSLTYPYQVIRSRLQVRRSSPRTRPPTHGRNIH